jgi:hypothetical protein
MTNDGLMSRHDMGVMITRASNRANRAEDKVERVSEFCDEQLFLINKHEKNVFDEGYEAALRDIREILEKEQD